MPSNAKAKRAILSLIPLEKGVIYELGSGWGGLALKIAKANPQAKVCAFELSLIPWVYSKLFVRAKNLRFYRKDFFKEDFRRAPCLVCYLFPEAMKRLQEKILLEKFEGFLVSNTFALRQKEALKVAEVGDLGRSKVYLYRF
jgi:16S rRNA A1518/A1519 N6-dimethyltransferase RsmA/KsgA/DIM1 with predicted DNA glycosylase/AP lyase activity